MTRFFAPLAGAFVLSLTLFVGCSDSGVSPSGSVVATTSTSDPYMYLKQDATVLNDFSEIPSTSDVMNLSLTMDPPHHGDSTDDTTHHPPGPPPGGDSSHHPPGPPPPPHGGDSSHHPPGPPADTTHHPASDSSHHPLPPPRRGNFGHMIPGSYGDVIHQLKLTAAQDSAVMNCFNDYRSCATSAAQSYAGSRNALADSMQSAMQAVRDGLAAGTITRDQARTMIDSIANAYRSQVNTLGASYKTADDACRTTFESCVSAQLTASQLTIWNRLTHR